MIKLLIADDNTGQRDFLFAIPWKEHGIFLCGAAESGNAALSLLESTGADVVLLDLNIPDMKGIDFLQAVSERKHPPAVVVLSGSVQYKYMRQAILCNASDYLLKPASAGEIIAAVKMPFDNGLFTPKDESLHKRAQAYIDEQYMNKISAVDVANALYVSPSYLSAVFSSATGETLTTYLNKVRIGEACRLLATTNLRIIEIAERTGYETEKYFYFAFKKRMGQTPSQYKKENIMQI